MLENADFFDYVRKNRRRNLWHKFVRVMACVVVFCTTYALILPAITQEQTTFCGLEEHSHNETCYAAQETGSAEQLLCVLEETEGHTHGSDCWLYAHTHGDVCYSLDPAMLSCGQEESQPHTHDANCYTLGEAPLICTEEESAGHSHGDACYTMGEAPLVCTLAEEEAHAHGSACYGEAESVFICTLEESEEHTHGEACYTQGEAPLVCTLEEKAGHSHSTDCYGEAQSVFTCTLTESEGHTHADTCYGAAQEVLSCTLQETQGHIHTELCYSSLEKILVCTLEERETDELICTQEEIPAHTHEDSCYETAEPELLCQLSEHIHTLSCFADLTADLENSEVWEKTLPDELTGIWAEDLLSVARSQLGYAESTKNYQILNDTIIKGYSRYGAWAGDPYGDWSIYFARFCLSYAQIPEEVFPSNDDLDKWIKSLNELGLYASEAGFAPLPGDVIFLDQENTVLTGIVTTVNDQGYVTAILGDYQDQVRSETFQLTDEDILGYAMLPYQEIPEEAPETTETTDSTVATTEPLEEDTTSTGETVTEETGESLNACMTFEIAKGELQGMAQEPYVLTAQSAATFSVASQSSGTDMTDLIVDLKVYHKTTAWGDTWEELGANETVKADELLRFGIQYQIPGGTLSATNNTIYYQLPVTQIAAAKEGNVYDNRGMKVGVYTISPSGMITITFDEYYVEENAKGVVIDGTINFDTSAEELDTDKDGEINLDFTESETVEITIEETVLNDLTVEKTASVISEADGTIQYTITVNSVNGTAGNPVELSDWMGNVAYYSGMTVTKNSAAYTVQDSNGNVVDFASGATSIDMTLDAMAAGDTYTITYVGKVINASGGTVSANNGVTVTSKNSDEKTLTDSASADVSYTYVMVDKTSAQDENGKITWTIQVGRAGESLEGWTLSDVLNGAALQADVTISGGSLTTPITRKLPYTFDSGVTGVVTVTYTTESEYNVGANSMSNTATLTPPTDEKKPTYSDTEYVTMPNAGTYNPLHKDATGLTVNADKTEAIIGWSYTISTDLGGLYTGTDSQGNNTGWYFTDALQNNQYFTQAQWEALAANLGEALGGATAFNTQLTATSAWNGTAQTVTYSAADGTKYAELAPVYSGETLTGFRVTVYQNLAKGKTFTFAYQSTGPLGDGTTQKHFQNAATVNDKVWESGSIEYYPTVMKMDAETNSADDSSHAQMNLINNAVNWKVQMILPDVSADVVITENLPDLVDLSSLSLTLPDNTTVSLYIPTNIGGYAETSVAYGDVSAYVKVTDISTADTMADDGKTIVTYGDRKFTVTIPQALAKAFAGQKLILNVNTTLVKDFTIPNTDGTNTVIESKDLSNTVTVHAGTGEDQTELGSDTHKQTITNEDTTKQIVKAAGTVEANIIPYTLTINPNAADLNPEGDTLTIEDRMTFWNELGKELFSANLVPNSVVVSQVDSNGVKTPLTYPTQYDYTFLQTVPSSSDAVWYQIVSTLKFTVPDETPLVIEYQYKISGTPGQGTTISNVASLQEVSQNGQSSTNQWFVVQDSEATADLSSINIHKVDKDNYNNDLSGATFEVYKWDAATNEWRFDQITTSTGTGGLELDDLVLNQAYYITEIKAPEGYVLEQSRHYFLIYDASKATDAEGNSTLVVPSDFPASAYVARGGNLYITNQHIGTSVGVKKVWTDANGNSIDVPTGKNADGTDAAAQIQVQLIQVRSRYPHDFDMDTIGESASVQVTFGGYSYQSDVYDNPVADAKIGDILTITLTTPNKPTKIGTTVSKDENGTETTTDVMELRPPGLMEVTSTENIHVPYTVDGNTYTFKYMIKDNVVNLRGWVYPENVSGATVTVSKDTPTIKSGITEPETEKKIITLSSTAGWEYLFSDLPQYELDSDGQITGYYSYYVKEISSNVDGYIASFDRGGTKDDAVEDGTVTVTNKAIPKTSISVQKQWRDNAGQITTTPGAENITFDLIQVTSKTKPEYAKVSFEIGAYATGQTNIEIADRVVPVGSKAYLTVISPGSNLQYWVAGSSEYLAQVGNTQQVDTVVDQYNNQIPIYEHIYEVLVTQDMIIQGYLGTGTGYYQYCDVSFETENEIMGTWKTGNPVEEDVTLSQNNEWTWSKDNLPLEGKDADGNLVYYSYYVRENNVPQGYIVTFKTDSISESTVCPDVTSGTLTIVNSDATTYVTVEKKWVDTNGNELTNTPELVNFNIYQSTAGSTEKTLYNKTPYIITKTGNWKTTVTDLPLMDGQGNKYTYSVDEIEVDGYESKVSSAKAIDGTYVFTITNTKNQSTETGLTVRKQWIDADGNAIANPPSSISFNLVKVAVPNNKKDVTIKNAKNTSHSVWSGSYPVGTELTVVVRTTDSEYSTYLTLDDWSTSVSTSKTTTSETIEEKVWYRHTMKYTVSESITLLVVTQGDSSSTFTVTATPPSSSDDSTTSSEMRVSTVTYELTAPGWEKVISGLETSGVYNEQDVLYSYRIEEISGVNENYLVTYSVDDGTPTNVAPSGLSGDETIVITNQLTETGPSYELPETGSIGTVPYTLGGVAMLLCGAWLWLLKRRQTN